MDLTERRFQTGLIELNYAEGPNNGPPFVVLHGGSASWQYGRELLEALASEWHVFAPDFRGHGLSGRVAGAYLVRDYVDDIAAWLAAAVGDPAVVYGHSLGGEVGVMVAAQQPHLVRALIIGDAPLSVHNHAMEHPAHRAQNVLWHRLAGRPVDEIAQALKDTPVRVPGGDSSKPAREVMGEDSPWYDFQALNLHLLDPDMLAAVLAGPEVMLDGYEPEVLLPKITCPVLLLQADAVYGSALSDADLAVALELLGDVTQVRLDGTGHELHGPPGGTARVLQVLGPFLERIRTGTVYSALA